MGEESMDQEKYQDFMLVGESVGEETREDRVTLGSTVCFGTPG